MRLASRVGARAPIVDQRWTFGTTGSSSTRPHRAALRFLRIGLGRLACQCHSACASGDPAAAGPVRCLTLAVALPERHKRRAFLLKSPPSWIGRGIDEAVVGCPVDASDVFIGSSATERRHTRPYALG